MNCSAPKLRAVLEEFKTFDMDTRADMLIEYGESFTEVPEHIARRPYPEQAKVPGCESEAYVFTEAGPEGTLCFHFAIENPQGVSAKAFAQILKETLSGEELSRIDAVSDEVVTELFGQGISMGKGLGLKNMLLVLKTLAKRAQAPLSA